MRQILFLFIGLNISLTGFAQINTKSDVTFKYIDGVLKFQLGTKTYVPVSPVKAVGAGLRLDPDGNLSADPLSSGVDAATLNAQLVEKKSWRAVATYQELKNLVPVANTLLEIFVRADEKRGGGPTTYNLMPNGDCYLTSFLVIKDN
ncbi:hypothetical protein [Spirosoma fluviale]|uniref:Glycosyl-hydrolase 97 N-terminal domain-containing protein n=1 Tax=Spirosoma fluviale TaxID=1597977 RepID=A0A286FCW4_9BACT|nr:hypothetical protein [Spirosoma fluviale]SOD81040.1 hypothetical protein SAMN06269250_1654 [Spirosoma fluviale]